MTPEQRTRARARSRAYYQAHLEEQRARSRAKKRVYDQAHREEQRAYARAYYQAHLEEQRTRTRMRARMRVRIWVNGERINLDTMPEEFRITGLLINQLRKAIRNPNRAGGTA